MKQIEELKRLLMQVGREVEYIDSEYDRYIEDRPGATPERLLGALEVIVAKGTTEALIDLDDAAGALEEVERLVERLQCLTPSDKGEGK